MPLVDAAARRLQKTVPNVQPIMPQSDTFSYSYQPDYQEGMRAALERRANLESQYGTQRNRLGEDYGVSSSDLSRQRDESLTSLRDQLGSQGIINSGINIAEQGKIQGAYGRGVESLNRNQSRGMEDLATGQATDEQGIQSTINQLAIQRAKTEEQLQLDQARQQAQKQANEQLMAQIQASMPQLSPTGQYQPAQQPSGYGTPPQTQGAPYDNAAMRRWQPLPGQFLIPPR